MVHVNDIEGYISLKEAKEDMAKVAELLVTTTDNLKFALRIRSIEALLGVLKRYESAEKDIRSSHLQYTNGSRRC